MKFIKTAGGNFINSAYTKYLDVRCDGEQFEIVAETVDTLICLRRFKSRTAAQAYLDTLIAELNKEDKPCGD